MATSAAFVAPTVTLVSGSANAALSTVSQVLRTLPYAVVAIGITFFAVYFLPEQTTAFRAIECGFREAGYFHVEYVEPVLARLSQIYNPLSCWWNTFFYSSRILIQNVLFDLFLECSGGNFITPIIDLMQAVLVDITVQQVLNYEVILSRPINTTAIVQPMKDIGTTLETVLCCGCNDLCILWQWVLAPLQDDNLYCLIQQAFDFAFWLVRPAFQFVIEFLYFQPLSRPTFGALATAWCRTVDCAGQLIGNFLQYLLDNILGLSAVSVEQIMCPISLFYCGWGKTLQLGLEAAVNADRVIGYPGDPYVTETLRPLFKDVMNLIAVPTEVLRLEDVYPAFLNDSIGASGYDYSTRLLPSEVLVTANLQQCLCTNIQLFTANITATTFDLCTITNLLTPVVDVLFFAADFSLNIFRLDEWAPRMDFAFVESIFLPGGALSAIPELAKPISPAAQQAIETGIAMMGEFTRWFMELIRVAINTGDDFGFFVPDSLYSGTRIRCSRFPAAIVPEAANSCSWIDASEVFLPALIDRAANAACLAEQEFSASFLLTFESTVVCRTAGALSEWWKALNALIIPTIYNTIFGDPDDWWGGPSEAFQAAVEEVGRTYVQLVYLGTCSLTKVIFKFFGLTSTADPCQCLTAAGEKLAARIGRLGASVIINFGREFSINAPYFRTGTQQSPGIDRTFMSAYDALGRVTGVGPKGDVDLVVEAGIEVRSRVYAW